MTNKDGKKTNDSDDAKILAAHPSRPVVDSPVPLPFITDDASAGDYGEKPGLLTKIGNTVRDGLSLLPSAVLTRYWSGAYKNANAPFTQYQDAFTHQIKLTAPELKKAETEVYDSFKNIAFIYAFHGKMEDLTTNTEMYKLSPDERDYIGLKTDKNGDVSSFLDGSEVVGYLHDHHTGARCAALKGKDGKITITIAGGALPNTSGYQAFKGSASAVFSSTAGNMTAQFQPIYDFAKGIEKKYGKIDEIDGHSLGGAVAEAMVPAFPNAKFHLFDAPGLNPALLGHMSDFYGKSDEELKALYSRKDAQGDYNIKRVRVNDNSYNTLGWIPVDISLTDPAKDAYFSPNPKNLLPKNHFYGDGYYEAIRALGGKLKGHNVDLYNNDISNDHSGGPLYITGVETAAAVGVAKIPYGIGPVLTIAGAAEGAWAHGKDNPKPLPKPSVQR